MTTSVFPTDTSKPFVAENGVTYVYESDRWRVKQYKLDDAALEGYATEQWTEEKIADAMIEGEVDLTNYATVIYSDAEDQELQNQIDELGVTKGKVARYTTENTSGAPVSRAGQLGVNASLPASVTLVSFGTEDADGILTKPMADGDIVEFVEGVTGSVSRFKILDATAAPTLVSVEHVSGDNDFVVGEEEQVYIYPQNASGASKDYVDQQDDLKLNLTGGNLSGELVSKTGTTSINAFSVKNQNDSETSLKIWSPGGSGTEVKYVGRNNTQQWFQSYDSGNAAVTTTAKFAFQSYTLTAKSDITYGASDAHYFKGNIRSNGTFTFARGTDKLNQFKISPNGNTDYATNIYALNGGQMRFRTSHTNQESDNVGSHIILDSVGGAPETKIYNVVTPTNDKMAVNKAYVDSVAGGVPTGSIVMWINSYAPEGWFKLKGGTFDINVYPALHTYLQNSHGGYVSGVLPDWRGHYPAQLGDHLTGDVGAKHTQRTAQPNGGPPNSLHKVPNGNTRTYNAAGGTNAYADGVSTVNISEGWDSVTRPPTIAVHFIIKA